MNLLAMATEAAHEEQAHMQETSSKQSQQTLAAAAADVRTWHRPAERIRLRRPDAAAEAKAALENPMEGQIH